MERKEKLLMLDKFTLSVYHKTKVIYRKNRMQNNFFGQKLLTVLIVLIKKHH